MTMHPGKMDRRITIQRFTTTKNAFNEDVEAWTDVRTVWAEAKPYRGSERFAAAEVAGSAVTTFVMRHWPDLTPKDRISYDGKTWDIHHVREIGRRRGSEADCTARSE